MFSIEDVWKMIDIIKKNQAVFIGKQLGEEYLSAEDRMILEMHGINVDDFDYTSDIEKSYYFGVMAQTLGGMKSYKVKEKLFNRWFESKMKKPVSVFHEQGLKHIKDRSFVDLAGLGNKVTDKLGNTILTANQKKRLNLVEEKSKEAVKDKKSQQWLASELGTITQDWAKDFSRMSNYIMQEAYGYGRAMQIFEDYGDDVEVYKQTFPGVCPQCLKNYGVPGEKPIVYKLKDLIANGNNIGKKEQDPVVGPAHPWARSILHAIPPNSEWSDESKRFVLKRNDLGVKRKSKVKVTITP